MINKWNKLSYGCVNARSENIFTKKNCHISDKDGQYIYYNLFGHSISQWLAAKFTIKYYILLYITYVLIRDNTMTFIIHNYFFYIRDETL